MGRRKRVRLDRVSAHDLPVGLDERDDPLLAARVGAADVLLRDPVDDLPGGVALDPFDDPAADDDRLEREGTELVDLLMVMVGWGDKWLAGEAGPPVLYRHHACGEIGGVDLRCAHCGEPMHAGDVDLLPGPGAAG
jgi:hypothetical protein